MNPERWRRIDAIFEAALERAPEGRSSFLAEACGDDAGLRREVETLLAADGKAEAFMEAPASLDDILGDRSGEAEEGAAIGPYRIVRRLDRGGMGIVYLATRADDVYQRQVAIKVLSPGMRTASLVRRFRSERQILASLDHPNIAKLFEGGTTPGGYPYLVMEYIEGLPIDEYCDRRRLAVRERLEIFHKVCSAVHYAHQNLVVHRDIKPSNILVTVAGEPRLLDFGIAKLLDPEAFPYSVEITSTGHRPMTPHYASPEQVRGEAITTATDVYSLGVVLYQLLAGRLPHRLTGLPVREVERILSEDAPSRPSTAVTRPEPAGELVLEQALAIDEKAPCLPASVSTQNASASLRIPRSPPQARLCWMIIIVFPAERVVLNVLPNPFKLPFVADNAIVVIALPKPARERWPIGLLDALDIARHCPGLESLDDLTKRKVGAFQEYDPVQVVGHRNGGVDIDSGNRLRQAGPRLFDHRAGVVEDHATVTYLAEVAGPALGAKRHEIGSGLRVVIAFETDRTPTVTIRIVSHAGILHRRGGIGRHG